MSQRRPSRWRSTPDLQLSTEAVISAPDYNAVIENIVQRATESIASLQARLDEAEAANAKLKAQRLTQRAQRSANIDYNELLKIYQELDHCKEMWEEARSKLEELERQCGIKDQSYTELRAVTNSLQRREKSLLEEKRIAEKTLEDAKHTWEAEKHQLLNRESKTKATPDKSGAKTSVRQSKSQEGEGASFVDALQAKILQQAAEIAELKEHNNTLERDRDMQREINNENRMTIADLKSGMDRIMSMLNIK